MARGAAVLLLAALALPFAAEAAPSAERQAELMNRLVQDCGSCHGLTMKGGLGPDLLPRRLADFSDESLVDTILHGREGTPMPPWSFELSPDEAAWLVDVLKKGTWNETRP